MAKFYLSPHAGKFAFPAPEIVVLLHKNILKWLYATPEISGTTDKLSTKAVSPDTLYQYYHVVITVTFITVIMIILYHSFYRHYFFLCQWQYPTRIPQT